MKDKKEYETGKPCDHPGCLNHISHPCEGCGRIRGFTEKELIVQEINQLPKESKKVVVLNLYEKLTFEEIQEVLGIPEEKLMFIFDKALDGVRAVKFAFNKDYIERVRAGFDPAVPGSDRTGNFVEKQAIIFDGVMHTIPEPEIIPPGVLNFDDIPQRIEPLKSEGIEINDRYKGFLPNRKAKMILNNVNNVNNIPRRIELKQYLCEPVDDKYIDIQGELNGIVARSVGIPKEVWEKKPDMVSGIKKALAEHQESYEFAIRKINECFEVATKGVICMTDSCNVFRKAINGVERLKSIGVDYDFFDMLLIRICMKFESLFPSLIMRAQKYILGKIDRGNPGRFNRIRKWITKQIRKIRGLFL